MFITKEDLRGVIYNYQLEQITLEDDSLIDISIAVATEETESYLSHRYDMDAAFMKQGAARSPLLMQIVKVLAVHHIVQLSNVDLIYDRVQKDYERWIDYLGKVADGKLSPKLPTLAAQGTAAGSNTGIVEWGSDTKLENNY